MYIYIYTKILSIIHFLKLLFKDEIILFFKYRIIKKKIKLVYYCFVYFPLIYKKYVLTYNNNNNKKKIHPLC